MTDTVLLTDDHRYIVNGNKEVPSVTRVIREILLGQPPWAGSTEAMEVGTYVHDMTAAYDQDDLDEDRLWEPARPYLEAWKRFRAESEVIILEVEKVVYSPIYQFAGTVDRIARSMSGEPTVIEVKTGRPEKWHAIQLAAYAMAADPSLNYQRTVVHLQPDGRYKLARFTRPDDVSTFRSALNVYHWRNHNG